MVLEISLSILSPSIWYLCTRYPGRITVRLDYPISCIKKFSQQARARVAVVQVVIGTGKIVNMQIKRTKVLEHFANSQPYLIAIKTCGGAYSCARVLRARPQRTAVS